MELGKSDLKKLIQNIARGGWSDKKINDMVDSLWREKFPWPDEVIYALVTWEGGLSFTGSPAKFRINNTHYKAPATAFTLDAADATYPRIDLVTLNTNGAWEIIKGTPAENPLKPTYDRDTNIEVTFIEVPALATQPANMVEGQIYNEHIAGEWTPSVVGTTADFDSTVAPSIGAKCAAVGALSNGDMIVFTAPEDYTDTDWSTLSFDLQLPDTNSKGHFIEVYFTYNGSGRSKMLYATFSRTNVNWQKVVFAIPDFAIRNALFNGLVLRWFNRSGATYAGIKIDNVRLQKGIELPEQTDNYVTGASWDEVAGTLTLHRTGALGDITVNLAGIDGEDGYTPVKGVDYFDGIDGHTPYIQGGYWYIDGVNTGVIAQGINGRGITSVVLHATVGLVKTYRMTFTDSTYFDYDVTDGAPGADGTDATTTVTITQSSHGLIVGDAVKVSASSGTWIKAQADSAANAGTLGIVCEIIDANTFVYQYGGILAAGTWTNGESYFLSPTTAGAIITEPASWTIGQVREFLGSGTPEGLLVEIDVGDEIGSVSADEKVKFDAADPTAGYLSEKVVPGANIAISEGTGADENKLKIAVTGLAAVALSGSYNSLTDRPTIPATADLPFQSLTAKDITPGTAQEYTLIPKCREGLTIDSFVYKTDDGTLTGCAVKIGSTAVTGLSSLSVGTTQAETNATGANTTAAGDRVTFVTSTGYTGTPTMIEVQLNYHKT